MRNHYEASDIRAERCMCFWMLVLMCACAILLFGHSVEAASMRKLVTPKKSPLSEITVLQTTRGTCSGVEVCDDLTTAPITCVTNIPGAHTIKCTVEIVGETTDLFLYRTGKDTFSTSIHTEDGISSTMVLMADVPAVGVAEFTGNEPFQMLIRLVGFHPLCAIVFILVGESGKDVQFTYTMVWGQHGKLIIP